MQSLRVELKIGDTGMAWHNIYHKFNRGHFAKNTACQYVIESCILNSPFNFHLPRLLCVVGLPVSSSSQVKPAGALSLSYQLIWYGQRSIYSGSLAELNETTRAQELLGKVIMAWMSIFKNGSSVRLLCMPPHSFVLHVVGGGQGHYVRLPRRHVLVLKSGGVEKLLSNFQVPSSASPFIRHLPVISATFRPLPAPCAFRAAARMTWHLWIIIILYSILQPQLKSTQGPSSSHCVLL